MPSACRLLAGGRPIPRADRAHFDDTPVVTNIEVRPLLHEEWAVGVADQEPVVDTFPIRNLTSLDMINALDHVAWFEPLVEHLVYDPPW